MLSFRALFGGLLLTILCHLPSFNITHLLLGACCATMSVATMPRKRAVALPSSIEQETDMRSKALLSTRSHEHIHVISTHGE